jgi:hypothetical protein
MRSVAHHFKTRQVLIDSAYRKPTESTSRYSVVFNSNTGEEGELLKDVIGIDVVAASLPRVSENVLSGFNHCSLALVTANSGSTSTTATFADVHTYATDLVKGTPGVIATVSITPQAAGHIAQITLNHAPTAPTTLCHVSTTQIPYFSTETVSSTHTTATVPTLTEHKEHFYCVRLPATSEPLQVAADGTLITPIVLAQPLDVRPVETHTLTLRPGFYASSQLMKQALLSAIDDLNPSSALMTASNLDSDLPTIAATSVDVGWGVGTTTYDSTSWRLTFLSNEHAIDTTTTPHTTRYPYDAILLCRPATHSQARHNFDLLTQLGVRTTNSIVAMDLDSSATTHSMSNSKRLFKLTMGGINMAPRRYVDVIIEQTPSAGRKYTNATNQMVNARIDLVERQVQDFDRDAAANVNTTDGFTQVSAYVSMVASDTQIGQHNAFLPITLKGLRVGLIDNLGLPYDVAGMDHTLELRVTMLGEPLPNDRYDDEHDDAPVARRRKRHTRTSRSKPPLGPPPQQPSPLPLVPWVHKNRFALAGTAATFAITLYGASRLRRSIFAPPQRRPVPPY